MLLTKTEVCIEVSNTVEQVDSPLIVNQFIPTSMNVLLTGPNGSGKSRYIETLDFIGKIVSKSIDLFCKEKNPLKDNDIRDLDLCPRINSYFETTQPSFRITTKFFAPRLNQWFKYTIILEARLLKHKDLFDKRFFFKIKNFQLSLDGTEGPEGLIAFDDGELSGYYFNLLSIVPFLDFFDSTKSDIPDFFKIFKVMGTQSFDKLESLIKQQHLFEGSDLINLCIQLYELYSDFGHLLEKAHPNKIGVGERVKEKLANVLSNTDLQINGLVLPVDKIFYKCHYFMSFGFESFAQPLEPLMKELYWLFEAAIEDMTDSLQETFDQFVLVNNDLIPDDHEIESLEAKGRLVDAKSFLISKESVWHNHQLGNLVECLPWKFHPHDGIHFLDLGYFRNLDMVNYFLKNFGFQLYLDKDPGAKIIIEKCSKELTMEQLSSGERSIISLVIAVCAHSRNSIVLNEPERFLHPNWQSLFAVFINDFISLFGVKVIIETHSEILIRRFQLMVARNEVQSKDYVIYYFRKQTAENVPPMRIDIHSDGRLSDDFPPGFLDESGNIAIELYKIQKDILN